jgi:hypothetical protein
MPFAGLRSVTEDTEARASPVAMNCFRRKARIHHRRAGRGGMAATSDGARLGQAEGLMVRPTRDRAETKV